MVFRLLLALGICIVVGLIWRSKYLSNMVTQILILGLYATSLNLLIGYTGMVSFGHGLFFGAGSYTAGILLQRFDLSPIVGLGASFFVCGIIAGLIAPLCVRLGSIYFAMLTLAFNQLLYVVIIKWSRLTGGDQGLIGGVGARLLSIDGLKVDLSDPRSYFTFTLMVVGGCFLLCKLVVNSPFGSIMRAIRENEQRVHALGVSVQKCKVIVFMLGGSIGGISGALMAFFVSGAYPDFAHWVKSAEPIFMILTGGMNTLWGPFLGALVLVVVINVTTMFTNLWGLVIGAVIVGVTMGARKGLGDFFAETFFVSRGEFFKRFEGKLDSGSTQRGRGLR
ncbi:MAG: branched-chain amino acid ABC transporter permease [Candidatus Methanomethylicaceae archaeon]